MVKKRRLPEKAKPYQFKPGVSGNPKGRPKLTQEQRELRALTLEKYRDIVQMILTGNLLDLQEMIKNPESSIIEVGIATALAKAIKGGDYSIMERVAERIIGKIPEEINVNSTNANLNSAIDPTLLKAALEQLEKDV